MRIPSCREKKLSISRLQRHLRHSNCVRTQSLSFRCPSVWMHTARAWFWQWVGSLMKFGDCLVHIVSSVALLKVFFCSMKWTFKNVVVLPNLRSWNPMEILSSHAVSSMRRSRDMEGEGGPGVCWIGLACCFGEYLRIHGASSRARDRFRKMSEDWNLRRKSALTQCCNDSLKLLIHWSLKKLRIFMTGTDECVYEIVHRERTVYLCILCSSWIYAVCANKTMNE